MITPPRSQPESRAAALLHAGRPAWIWLRRLAIAALLACLLAYLPYRIHLRSGLARLLSLQGDLRRVREENGRLQKDNRRLRQELDRLRDNDLAIERVAREELGLIRPGEVVFKVLESR